MLKHLTVLALLAGLYVSLSARRAIIVVNAGGNLQAALNSAADGDEIHLEAGATFTGNYTIPSRSPQVGTVIVKTAGTLPNRRIDITDAASLATINAGNNDPAIDVGTSANAGWTFQGIQVLGGIQEIIIVRGASRITFDRVLIVGGGSGTTRGIRGNGTTIELTRSYISNIWQNAQDAQAFCAWDGAGPYVITDNYLEASGENIMFGGADSTTAADIPADITFTDNLVYKPDAWRPGGAEPHLVKNQFELKNAKRVTIRNNRFEGNWTSGQPGYGIVFTPRNQDGSNPWAVVEDVTFENNVVISEKGINMIGYDDLMPSGRLQRVTFAYSLFITEQTFCQVGGEANDVTMNHLTIANASNRVCTLYMGDVWPSPAGSSRAATFALEDYTMTNSVMSHRDFGMFADGDGQGTSALNFMVLNGSAGYVWTNNAVAETVIAYPSGTLTPDQATHDAQFLNTTTYPLIPGSIYRGVGTGGSDLGWIVGSATPQFRLRIRR